MADTRKLDAALDALVHEGSLSAAQADLVRVQYKSTEDLADSRKSILAEIAGYLGGAFVVIAVTIVTAITTKAPPRYPAISAKMLFRESARSSVDSYCVRTRSA